jgi:hypothetical protein
MNSAQHWKSLNDFIGIGVGNAGDAGDVSYPPIEI